MAEIDPRLQAYLGTNQKDVDPRLKAYLSDKSDSPVEQVVNESSDIPWEQRAAVKNFGGSLNDQVSYLKERNPNLDVSLIDGDIVARNRGDKIWKKLDPTGFSSVGEFFQDLTDIPYDLASGALSSLASAAGGILGAAASPYALGLGAIPASAAAGGTTSAGLEAVRQAIGRTLGTAKKTDSIGGLDWKDIGISGGLGAVGAPLFGTGATAKQVSKAVQFPSIVRGVLEKSKNEAIPAGAQISNAQKNLAKQIIMDKQGSSLFKLPKAALSAVSGIPDDTLRTATDKADPDVVKKLFKGGLKLNPNKQYTNLELADWIEQGGVDSLGQVAQSEMVDKVQGALAKTGKKIDNALSVATDSGKKIDISPYAQPFDDLFRQFDTAAKESDSIALRESADKVQKLKEKYFSAGVTEVSPNTAFTLKNELADLVDFNRTPVQVGSQLESAISQAERGLRDAIYNTIDGNEARKAYAEHSEIKEGLYKFFKNQDTAVNTLKNIETLRSPTLKKYIEKFDKKYGANLSGLSDVATTWKYFGRPPSQPIVGGGSGQFWRGAGAGGALGSLVSGYVGLPPSVGGAVGGLTGAFLTSPKAIKKGLELETSVSRLGNNISNLPVMKNIVSAPSEIGRKLPPELQTLLTIPAAYQSAWRLMGDNK